MDDWDERTKDIVSAITDVNVLTDFAAETQTPTGQGLEEIVSIDRVINEDGKIAVRRITRLFDDGKEVSKKYHRSWIMPGDDTNDADVMSQAVAAKIHTVELIDAFNAKIIDTK